MATLEMLGDLIVAAINEANRKVDEAMKGSWVGCCHQGWADCLAS